MDSFGVFFRCYDHEDEEIEGHCMKKILLVEDEEHLQSLIRDELLDDGYEVTIASDGIEALNILNTKGIDPDLIILDIRMPKMDGFETMGHILKSKIDVPIIIHTAYAGYQKHPLSLAADAYIVKSYNMCPLKNTISELLEKRRREAQSVAELA
jgi:CheY-like chemotaxis protein